MKETPQQVEERAKHDVEKREDTRPVYVVCPDCGKTYYGIWEHMWSSTKTRFYCHTCNEYKYAVPQLLSKDKRD